MEMNEEMIVEDLIPAEEEVSESGSDDSAKVLAAVGIGIVAIGVGIAASIARRTRLNSEKSTSLEQRVIRLSNLIILRIIFSKMILRSSKVKSKKRSRYVEQRRSVK